MSEHFQMLVDPEVAASDVPDLAKRLVNEFRRHGLITGGLTRKSVLCGVGYVIGPAVQQSYQLAANEGPFWTLIACGVEVLTERTCNLWSLGPACEYFVCPRCNTKHGDLMGQTGDSILTAVGNWHEQEGPSDAYCESCGKSTCVTKWCSRPPVGYGNLALRFWNWPPFDSVGWSIDIPQIFSDTTGHECVLSWGRM